MIISFILSAITGIIAGFLRLLPQVDALPTIGGVSMETSLVTAFGWWNDLIFYLWPLEIVWACVLWYIGINIGIMVAQFFFGSSRIPKI